jgi:serine protease Do
VQDARTEDGSPVVGAVITQIEPGSSAEHAQLAPGMIVIQAAGKTVRSAADLTRILRSMPHGSMVLLRIQANDSRLLRAVMVP